VYHGWVAVMISFSITEKICENPCNPWLGI
jgi:hypothetical protein